MIFLLATFIQFSTSDVSSMFGYTSDLFSQLTPIIAPLFLIGIVLIAIVVIIRSVIHKD
jgi:hypothetical protein